MKKYISLLFIFFFFNLTYAQTDTLIVVQHLKNITKTTEYRNYKNIETLNYVAAYIFDEFKKYTPNTRYQEYELDGKVYKNVIANFGPSTAKTIVVGAHYDVCGEQEGADDNASGVVGLLELARQLQGQNLNYNIELVAFTLEEPPYFRTEYMGSYIHAKSLHDSDREVFGMVSLEMIGYFKDEKNTQNYPIGILSWFYGNRGDYITIVSKFGKGKFARKFTREFLNENLIKTKKFTGPKSLPGIDFSDHLNYWKFGYSALMLTDTAFYRNPNYHKKTDKMETLDIYRMSKVIDNTFKALINL
jgi:hypothetical protein